MSQEPASFFQLLRAALAGKEHDYTAGPMRQAIALLAIPMVLEMAMESTFVLVDILFVSRLGADAVAVVGLTEAVVTLIYAIAVGFGTAATALVARRIGERKPDAAAVVAGQALWIGLAASALIGFAGVSFARDILLLMGASSTAVAMGSGYTAILLGGSITILYLFIIAAIFRGAGDARLAMWALWLANGCNIILDPCLIFGLGPFPELGVTGAAVATTIGRGIGVVYGLALLIAGAGRVKLRLGHLRIVPSVIMRLLSVTVGGVSQHLLATSSWIVLMRIVAAYGSVAIAGFTIAIRLIDFALLPSWGLSNATATLVGQNLGARQSQRAEQAVWQTARYNLVFLGGIALLFIVFAHPILRVFSPDSQVIAYGVDALRLISFGYIFYAFGMTVTQAFNGAGDTRTPALINLFCFWLVQIPLAYTLAEAVQLGPRGVFLAVTIAESLIAVIAVVIFRTGRWKETMV